MMMPKNVWANQTDKDDETSFNSDRYKTLVINSEDHPQVGFRIFDLSAFAAESKRDDATYALAESGAIRTGDILLTFRPNWSKFMAYNRVQMGVSHTAVAVVRKDAAGRKYVLTLEAPLNYSSRLKSRHHYFDANGNLTSESAVFFHILRPKLSPDQMARFEVWADKLIPQISTLYPSRLPFEGDYAAPENNGTLGDRHIEDIGRIIKGARGVAPVSTYCSEWARAILILFANCDYATFNVEGGNACVPKQNPAQYKNPQFALNTDLEGGQKTAGMMSTPSNVLTHIGFDKNTRSSLLSEKILVDGPAVTYRNGDRNQPIKPANMSGGHYEVAMAFRDYIKNVNQFYGTGETNLALKNAINGGISRNYSPTSFLALTTIPRDAADPGTEEMRYVGTLAFKNIADFLN